MLTALIAIGVFVWYVVGVASAIYVWTVDFDFDWDDIPLMLFSGLLGFIFSFIAVCVYFDEKRKARGYFGPIIKRRQKPRHYH